MATRTGIPGLPFELVTRAQEASCILVVDDDPGIQQLERLVLEEHGYTVLVVGSGEEALDLLSHTTPDLVLLDVELGGIDGFTTCQRIRQFLEVPILMVTSRDSTGDKIWGLEIGADDYLTKPFHPDELLARTKAGLRRSGNPACATELASMPATIPGLSDIESGSQPVAVADFGHQWSENDAEVSCLSRSEVGGVYGGIVDLEIRNPGPVRQLLNIVEELRQDGRFRLYRLVANKNNGMDIRVGLREPLQLGDILFGMENVLTVNQRSPNPDDQKPAFVVGLKSPADSSLG